MSTACTISIYEEASNDILLQIYKKYDGGPENIAMDLFLFARGLEFIPGLSTSDFNRNDACLNMGDFAAQYISHIKRTIGDVYIIKVNSNMFVNYHYQIRFIDNKLWLIIYMVQKFGWRCIYNDAVTSITIDKIKEFGYGS